MIIVNKKCEITEEYNIENYKNNNNKLKIILKRINTKGNNFNQLFEEIKGQENEKKNSKNQS